MSHKDTRNWVDSLNKEELTRELRRKNLSANGAIPLLIGRFHKLMRDNPKNENSVIKTVSYKNDDKDLANPPFCDVIISVTT